MKKRYTIGLDFGSLSGRAVLVDASDGTIVAEAERSYPHGAMDDRLPDGTKLENGWVLQDSADFRMVLLETIPELLQKSGVSAAQIVGIGVDFTSSTVVPLDENFVPLSENPAFAGRPHAWTKMWKHNAARVQAEKMDEAARKSGLPYPDWYGGAIPYQSLLPKVIQVFEEDREVYEHTACFMECADYITSLLAGHPTVSASIAAARAVWTPENGYPDAAYFCTVDKNFEVSPVSKLGSRYENASYAYPWQKIGALCSEMAEKLGLRPGIALAAPQMDGYAAMPAVGITDAGEVMLVIGTSTAIMLLSRECRPVEGITACVPNTYYPNLYGYASGQSGVGDCFRWVVENCVSAEHRAEAERRGVSMHQYLTELAASLNPGETGLVALDWLGGNKSCLANSALSGVLLGLTLKTKPEHIYRAFQEATAYGCRVVLEAYEDAGVPIRRIVACGGIAVKNPQLMQLYADILGRELEVNTCAQAPALGSAIYAASAAQCYPDIFTAVRAMSATELRRFTPDAARQAAYNELYREYRWLHDLFGRENPAFMEQMSKRRRI